MVVFFSPAAAGLGTATAQPVATCQQVQGQFPHIIGMTYPTLNDRPESFKDEHEIPLLLQTRRA